MTTAEKPQDGNRVKKNQVPPKQQQSPRSSNGHPISAHSTTTKTKVLHSTVVVRRKSSSSTVSTMLSLAIAFSLFQTFSYQPPSHLDALHPDDYNRHHHHPSKLLVNYPLLNILEGRGKSVTSSANDQVVPDISLLPLNFGKERALVRLRTNRTLAGVLKEANVYDSLTDDEIQQLPYLEQTIKALYGPFPAVNNTAKGANAPAYEEGPVIFGMDTCETYRQMVPNVRERYIAPAGMFNTGTNNLEDSLLYNLALGRTGAKAYYQVPWGKHRMEARRLNHKARRIKGDLDQTKCLPVVIVRDPYQWMQSMCKAAYAAKWKHGPKRCPNLVPSKEDQHRFKNFTLNEAELHRKDRRRNSQYNVSQNDHEDDATFQVMVKFDSDDIEYFDSLVELWNEWYGAYWRNEKKYPRLIVRFEDMLLYAPQVMEMISDCFGVPLRNFYTYEVDSAKVHGSHSNFVKTIFKTADTVRRSQGLTLQDKLYAAKHLDHEMMQAFQYRVV